VRENRTPGTARGLVGNGESYLNDENIYSIMYLSLKIAVYLFSVSCFLTLTTGLYLIWWDPAWHVPWKVFLTALILAIAAASYIAIIDAIYRIKRNGD
jgi:uncharacterized membrane protein